MVSTFGCCSWSVWRFPEIKHALDSVSADNEQEVNTRRGEEGLSKKVENLETIFLTILWNDMLERMNKTSKVLQSKDVNILVATNLLESMKTYLQENRDKFSEYDFQARSVCPDTHYKARSVYPDTHYKARSVCPDTHYKARSVCQDTHYKARSVCPDTHYKARSVYPDNHYSDEKQQEGK